MKKNDELEWFYDGVNWFRMKKRPAKPLDKYGKELEEKHDKIIQEEKDKKHEHK